MDTLETHLDTSSADFAANRAHKQSLVADLRTRLEAVKAGGGERAVERHRSRGKLFVRDRIAALIDPDTPLLEFSALAAGGIYGGAAPGAGVDTAIGTVEGRPCVIVANDATGKAAT